MNYTSQLKSEIVRWDPIKYCLQETNFKYKDANIVGLK
jgi:hypothetical protein